MADINNTLSDSGKKNNCTDDVTVKLVPKTNKFLKLAEKFLNNALLGLDTSEN